jgi:hypothetical protein
MLLRAACCPGVRVFADPAAVLAAWRHEQRHGAVDGETLVSLGKGAVDQVAADAMHLTRLGNRLVEEHFAILVHDHEMELDRDEVVAVGIEDVAGREGPIAIGHDRVPHSISAGEFNDIRLLGVGRRRAGDPDAHTQRE